MKKQAVTKSTLRRDIISKSYTLADLTLFKEKKSGIYEYSCYKWDTFKRYFYGIVLSLLYLLIVSLFSENIENSESILIIIGGACVMFISFFILFMKAKVTVDRNLKTICITEAYGLYSVSYSTDCVIRFTPYVETSYSRLTNNITTYSVYMHRLYSTKDLVYKSMKELPITQFIKDLEILTDIADSKTSFTQSQFI